MGLDFLNLKSIFLEQQNYNQFLVGRNGMHGKSYLQIKVHIPVEVFTTSVKVSA